MKKLCLATLLFLTACSTTTIRYSDQMPPVRPNHKDSGSFFIGGVGQENIIDLKEYCQTGVNTVKTYYSFVDGLVATVTFGIYTPNTYEVYCNRPKQYFTLQSQKNGLKIDFDFLAVFSYPKILSNKLFLVFLFFFLVLLT